MLDKFLWIIAVLTFLSNLALANGEHSEVVGQEKNLLHCFIDRH